METLFGPFLSVQVRLVMWTGIPMQYKHVLKEMQSKSSALSGKLSAGMSLFKKGTVQQSILWNSKAQTADHKVTQRRLKT